MGRVMIPSSSFSILTGCSFAELLVVLFVEIGKPCFAFIYGLEGNSNSLLQRMRITHGWIQYEEDRQLMARAVVRLCIKPIANARHHRVNGRYGNASMEHECSSNKSHARQTFVHIEGEVGGVDVGTGADNWVEVKMDGR
jgi:hypothetical protein